MAQYKIGTISITSGTNVVTGVGTLFLANVSVGDSFKVTGVNALYGVIAVDSNTQLRISPNYAGTTVVAGQYQVTSDFTANLGLAEISAGDSEVAFHLTHEVIRKLDSIVAGKAAIAGPGSSQAFSVGALTAAGGVLSSSGTQGVHLSATENSINYGYGQNADALTYINLYGYQNGVTRYRSLEVRDGKAGLIAHFDGPTGRVFVGSGVDNGSGAKLQVSGGVSAKKGGFGGTGSDLSASVDWTPHSLTAAHNATGLYGWIQCNGAAETDYQRLLLNPRGGNVLLATGTDNGSGAKLQVAGGITSFGPATSTVPALGLAGSGANSITNATGAYGLRTGVLSSGYTYLQTTRYDGDATAYNMLLNPLGGNILIATGVDNGSGAKLQVNGNITCTTLVSQTILTSTSFVLGCPAGSPPALSVNSSMTAYLFNNTTLVFQARGSDGVTRSASLTLA